MKKDKRGQVAMEFLMTYGWAIIIIVIAVAALAYLGVFSTKTPTICQVDAPLNCKDMKIVEGGLDKDNKHTADTFKFTLKAGGISGGEGNKFSSISINSGENKNFKCKWDPNDQFFSAGRDVRLRHEEFSCKTAITKEDSSELEEKLEEKNLGNVGDHFEGVVTLVYITEGGLDHSKQMIIRGEIEAPTSEWCGNNICGAEEETESCPNDCPKSK